MTYEPLKIGNLTVPVPLIQGGMGVGISLGGLAGAVAAQGGIGIISTAQIGFREPDFEENPFAANIRAIGKEIAKARELAPRGVIGCNIMVALSHYKEYVTEAAKAGADVIISGAGLATELPEHVKGFVTKIAPIVSSKKATNVILKLWDKHYHRTADFIVIEGPKAGGHLGFSKEEIEKSMEADTYDAEIRDIIGVVKQYEERYGTAIPVIVAGGITTREDVQHAMELGANGVQVATRFVTTQECDADIAYKQAYINCKKEDIKIVKSPVGMPGRAIENAFMKKVGEGITAPPKKCLGCLKSCNPAEIPYCITERLIAAAKGDVEEALLFCGANAWKEERITTVKEVTESLF